MPRTLIIGDVHGCIDELNQLLIKMNYDQSNDRLLFVGDLINRGPDSLAVFLRFKELKAISVIGNHELHLLKHEEKGSKVPWIENLRLEFGSYYSDLIEDIKRWPLYLEENDFFLVHGGVIPGSKPGEGGADQITTIRTWDGKGKNLKSSSNPAWFDFYKEKKTVVFGHWAALEGVVRENVIGLDTGCVYGKKLTGIIFPEKKIVSVKAKQVYSPII